VKLPVRLHVATSKFSSAWTKKEPIRLANFNQEVKYLTERVRMAIVYRSRWMAEAISDYFKKHEMAIEAIDRSNITCGVNPLRATN
jgi:hypothetical protein